MSTPHFKEEELADAKQAFAEAWLAEAARSPFKPDPFRAALTVWNEDNGQLPRALWVAHAAKWHETAEVLAFVENAFDAIKEESLEEKLVIIRDKDKLAEAVMLKLYDTLMLAHDPDSVVKLSKELTEVAGARKKPADDDLSGRIIGVIQHELKPIDKTGQAIPYDDRVRNQQRSLQNEVAAFEIELEGGENARLIN
jgi:hypothetical protein